MTDAVPGADGDRPTRAEVLHLADASLATAAALELAAEQRTAQARDAQRAGRGPTQAQELLGLADDLDRFRAPDGQAYARATVGEHVETWRMRGSEVRHLLRRRYYAQHARPPSSQALSDALGVLEALAEDGPTHEVHVRCARVDDRIYLDLGNESWRVVAIDREGWRVQTSAPDHVRFRRPRGMLALPEPERGSIDELARLLRLEREELILIVSWIVMALSGRGPYPVLVLTGEAGAGKSTLARMLVGLVDPRSAPLRRPPRDERDLMIAARHSLIVALDNLSSLPPWLSDALCAVATGGGLSTRELYSDDAEVLYDAMRPIVLTGIDDAIAGRSDLVDRSLAIGLRALPDGDRRDERALWTEYEAACPRILGALLDALACGLRDEEDVVLPVLPRMADYARWSAATAPALGWTAEDHARAYAEARRSGDVAVIEASIVGAALLALLDGRGPWEGTSTELLAELERHATEDQRRSRSWPSSARALSGQLSRLAPALRRTGLGVDRRRAPGDSRRRIIAIDRVADSPSRPSRMDISSPDRDIARDGTGTLPSREGDRPSRQDVQAAQSDSAGRDGRDGRDGRIPTPSMRPATSRDDEPDYPRERF